MERCHIFCAGGFTGLIAPIFPHDSVIAADGGLLHTQALELRPRLILGDFDSLGYVPQGEQVLRHPVEKDDTDSMLAIRQGLDWGYRSFLLYGSLDGPRLDHTIANLQALGFLACRDAHGYLVGKDYVVGGFPPGRLSFSENARGTLSLFCLGEPVEGLTLRGLHYGLDKGRLTAHFPLGVSNHFEAIPSEITWEKGILLGVWQREAPLPEYTAAKAP